MAYDPKKVVEIALAEVGYLEKATNAQLDDKTANAGKKNYTKYARDLAVYPFYNGSKRGVAWCDVFVDWCFVQAYGLDAARKLTFQPTNPKVNYGAGCKYSRNYYKAKGRLFDTPAVGDQIFFYSSNKSSIQHTGLVYAVDAEYVYTVEGNTSGASGVIANGGGVFKKKYKRDYSRLAGFGRPEYGVEASAPSAAPDTTESKPAQESVVYDMKTLRSGSRSTQVKVLQWRLNSLGFDCGTVDGIFGDKTLKAVRAYQEAKSLTVDGIVGKKTWTAILA